MEFDPDIDNWELELIGNLNWEWERRRNDEIRRQQANNTMKLGHLNVRNMQ